MRYEYVDNPHQPSILATHAVTVQNQVQLSFFFYRLILLFLLLDGLINSLIEDRVKRMLSLYNGPKYASNRKERTVLGSAQHQQKSGHHYAHHTSGGRARRLAAMQKYICCMVLFAMISLFAPTEFVSPQQYLRRLAERCIKNVYATPEIALNLPGPPDDPSAPTYVVLCRELLVRNVNPGAASEFVLTERWSTCMDWSAPHLGL